MNKKLKFWDPTSGALGGMIAGVTIIFITLLLMPPLIKFMHWWSAVWGV